MTIEELYQLYLQHPVISTDTRKIAKGCLFFALKGDKFDANTFAAQAIEAGAAYAVVDNADYGRGDQFILVDDVLTALQDLARHHRRQLKIPVIGLTGTNGKTTTKELIYSVLSTQYNTLATQGNLNNHIGVPLTILSINSSHEMAVIEMGANHQKEIELLSSIAQPTHGLITNVGKAHLEGFGGFEGVKIGKGELYDYLAKTDGVVFINGDNEHLMGMLNQRQVAHKVFYGSTNGPGYNISGTLTSNSPYLSLQWQKPGGDVHKVTTNLTGAYNLDNVLAAICIGSFLGMDADKLNEGIENYQPKNSRSQIIKTDKNTLICDYYNANPSSMAVAIENVAKIEAGSKAVILGDMFEMGSEAETEHKAIVQKALETPIGRRIFIGAEFYKQQAQGAEFYHTVEEASEALKANPLSNSTVLLKGSRGMALERLVEIL